MKEKLTKEEREDFIESIKYYSFMTGLSHGFYITRDLTFLNGLSLRKVLGNHVLWQKHDKFIGKFTEEELGMLIDYYNN